MAHFDNFRYLPRIGRGILAGMRSIWPQIAQSEAVEVSISAGYFAAGVLNGAIYKYTLFFRRVLRGR